MNVACCQLAPRVGELEANRAHARAAILEAAEGGARIVVLPELANSGYVFADAAVCDRCGTERGVDWVSGTAIVGPDGFPLAGSVCADEPTTIVASWDLGQAGTSGRASARTCSPIGGRS